MRRQEWTVAYKVIQWSTGNVGKFALKLVAEHPELELVGLWVHSEDKAGKDAGELAGIGTLGVAATNGIDWTRWIVSVLVAALFCDGRRESHRRNSSPATRVPLTDALVEAIPPSHPRDSTLRRRGDRTFRPAAAGKQGRPMSGRRAGRARQLSGEGLGRLVLWTGSGSRVRTGLS